MRRLLAAHGIWIAVIATEFAAASLANARGVQVLRPDFWDWGFVRLLLVVALCWLPVRLARIRFTTKVAGGPGWRMAIARLRAEQLSLQRISTVLMTIALIVCTTRMQQAWKSWIGPYVWDATIAGADRTLHGGDAWARLWPILGTPGITHAFDKFYLSWYSVFALGLVWQAWTLDSRHRRQFWTAFGLVFAFLGIVLAHLLASGGPVFYGGLVPGPNPFAPFVAKLLAMHAASPLAAVQFQQLVWDDYARGAHMYWISMSAMPSIHVAMAVLFACALRRLGWLPALLGWTYVALTLIGSVQLGWHYALDGEVALVATVAIWYLSGWLVRPRS
jgi:hypothetical protein